MNVLQKLILRHLRISRRRTAMTVIAIALSVAMGMAASGIAGRILSVDGGRIAGDEVIRR